MTNPYDNPAPTALERLSRAFAARDLTLREGRCDADVLIALGWSGMGAHRAASALLRLVYNFDPEALREARSAVISESKRANKKQRWGHEKVKDLIEIADLALAYYLARSCPTCRGRMFELVPGVPSLSAVPCKTCHGTGRRPLPAMHRREVADMVAILDDEAREIQRRVQNRLRAA